MKVLNPPPPAIPCPKCHKPGVYIRTRFEDSHVFMCDTPDCVNRTLYFYEEKTPQPKTTVRPGEKCLWYGKVREVKRFHSLTSWVFFTDGSSAVLSPQMDFGIPQSGEGA